MESQQKRGNANSFESIINVVDSFATFVSLIIGNAEVCTLVLALLLVSLCAVLYSSNLNNKRIKNDEVRRQKGILEYREQIQSARCEDTITENEFREEERKLIQREKKLKEKYLEKIRQNDEMSRNIMIKILISFVAIFLLNYDTVQPFLAKQIINIIEELQTETDTSENGTEIEIEAEEEKTESGEKGKIIKGKTFHLNESSMVFVLGVEEVREVFGADYEGLNKEHCVKEQCVIGLSTYQADTYTYNLSKLEEKAIMRAVEKETLFEASIIAAKMFAKQNDYTKWSEVLMSSDELDDILEERKAVWDSGKRNAELAWLIANDHQAYALEFEHQTSNENAILYHYVQSIIWAKRSIMYEDSNKEECFCYIKGRYKDIADCEFISIEYADAAQLIHDAMGEYSDYIEVK